VVRLVGPTSLRRGRKIAVKQLLDQGGRRANTFMDKNLVELTEQNWQSEVLASSQPVLVDFWAPWCAPCRQIAPTIEALAGEYAGRVKVGKLNVDDHSGVAAQYGIRSIPTVLLFKGGKVAEQRIGLASRAELTRIVDEQLRSGAPA
jgi:thioredoxin 1